MRLAVLTVYVIFVTMIAFAIRGLASASETTRSRAARRLVFAGGSGGALSHAEKRDCDVETIYSMLDEHCDTVCKGPGIYRTKRGACVNLLVFDSASAVGRGDACDSRRGVLAYVAGNAQLGNTSLVCLSIDPGIAPDDPSRENRICENGFASIDYDRAFPETSECRCANDETRVLVPETSNVRSRAVCANARFAPLLRYNDAESR